MWGVAGVDDKIMIIDITTHEDTLPHEIELVLKIPIRVHLNSPRQSRVFLPPNVWKL